MTEAARLRLPDLKSSRTLSMRSCNSAESLRPGSRSIINILSLLGEALQVEPYPGPSRLKGSRRAGVTGGKRPPARHTLLVALRPKGVRCGREGPSLTWDRLW